MRKLSLFPVLFHLALLDSSSSSSFTGSRPQLYLLDKRPITQRIVGKLFILIIAICLQLVVVRANTGEKSLYTDKDHVLELNITNFDSNVYNQPRAFFVEFYAR